MKKNFKKTAAMLTAVSVLASGMTVFAANDAYSVGTETKANISQNAPEQVIKSTVKKLDDGEGSLAIASNDRVMDTYEWEVLKRTNRERLAEGLWPLSINDAMLYAAEVRAGELTINFEHTRPNGTEPWTVFDENSIAYAAAGENIAYGYNSPASVVEAWMNSSGHRANILSESFVHMGAGHTQGNKVDFWTQLFLDAGCNPRLTDLASDVDGASAYHVGTPIDSMPLALIAECEEHGACYIPVLSGMCTGLDVNKLGTQELAIEYNGYQIKAPITMHPFTDLGNAWYTDWTVESWLRGTMTGLDSTTFGPLQTLRRSQFAIMLYRMNGEPPVQYVNIFPDVVKDQWYTSAVLWANSAGVVTGYTDTGMFGTGDQILREQMAVMMYRYADYKGYDVSNKTDISRFADGAAVSAYAKDAMQWAVANGIITGKDNGTRIDPFGYASRAECAAIITRFQDLYE